MTMLVLDLVFLVAAFGARTFVQWRRTGDAGWRLGRPSSSSELAARALLVVGGVLLGCALFDEPATGAPAVVGVALAAGAIALVIVAQLQMGASWRIGLDPDEQTELVRSGLYRSIRNPIYTGMVLFGVGQALVLPGLWSVAGVVCLGVGVAVQVRLVEEPYLRALHREAYTSWAARAGRFVPLVGRLS